MIIKDDQSWNIPYLQSCTKDSPAWNQIPSNLRRNHFIVAIGTEEPYTAAYAYELLQPSVRRSQVTDKIKLQLAPRKRKTTSEYETLRAAFDTMRPILAATIAAHQAILPETPPNYDHAHEAFKGPHKKHWYAAAYHQYDKNRDLCTFSKPTKRDEIDLIKNKTVKVHKSILAPKVKRNKEVYNLFEFSLRHCFDGSRMEPGLDYEHSYSPTLGHESAKWILAVAAIYFMTLGVIDIKCAFQNILSDKDIPNFCSLPFLYKEWYEKRTNTKLEGEAKDYCLQVLTNFQGQKDAGRKLYKSLLKLFLQNGFTKSSVDHSVFTKVIDGRNFHVCLSTDDFLCAYHDVKHFNDFCDLLKQYFTITIETGPVIHYLNLTISQSDQGISFDQTDSILSTLQKYFGKTDVLKTVTTPFRTDNEVEQELAETPPADPITLKKLEKQFGGSYRALLGSLLHYTIWTRSDLAYAISRLSTYSAAPNQAAFEQIKRVFRNIAHSPHRPIFIPKTKEKTNTQMIVWNPDNKDHFTYSNQPTIFADAGDPRDLVTYRSMTCNILTINGTAITWECKKTPSVCLHSTDAELRGLTRANLRAKTFRHFMTSINYPLEHPITIYQDNEAVQAIATAGKMTPRTKNLGIQAAYCQQEQERENTAVKHIETKLMLADMGTKPLAGPTHKRFSLWACGERFYPDSSSEQYKQMRLEWFNLPYLAILKLQEQNCNNNDSSESPTSSRSEEGRVLADGFRPLGDDAE